MMHQNQTSERFESTAQPGMAYQRLHEDLPAPCVDEARKAGVAQRLQHGVACALRRAGKHTH